MFRKLDVGPSIQHHTLNHYYFIFFTWITGAHLGGAVTGAVEGAVLKLAGTALYLTQRAPPGHITQTPVLHAVAVSITLTVTAFTCTQVQKRDISSKYHYKKHAHI